MDRGELEGLDRESLVVRAQAAGIRRARILTRPELIDELLRLDPSTDDATLRKSRGFFGRARDLVARVVERGLHLPDAADRIRTMAMGPLTLSVPRTEPQAMPTVTLAEIYAAQGHSARAIETLRRVLEREPEHAAARALLARLEDEGYVSPPVPLPPEPEIEAAIMADDADDAPNEPSVTDDVTRSVADAAAELAQLASPAADPRDEDEDAQDGEDEASDAPTIVAGFPKRAIEGPSYDDASGVEFHLAPSSDRGEPPPPALAALISSAADEVFEEDPAYAPTRELPHGAGRTYTFVAPRDGADVDAHANTDVFNVLPERPSHSQTAETQELVIPAVTASAPQDDVPDEDVDECFAIPLGQGRMYVRWSVSWSTIGALLGARPGGRFVVRAHIVTPAWDGPNVESRDLKVDPDDGETMLRALPEPAVVRVAVGWLDPEGARATFVPLAHSPALEMARERDLVIWTTKGAVPVALDDPKAAPIARTLEASRRAALRAHG